VAPTALTASHKTHREWTPQRLLDWGERIDPHTRQIVEYQLTDKPHPEMGYRVCLGLLLDRELAWSDYKRLVRLRKQAKLKYASVCL
jgi:hypothetical protein